MKKTPKLENVHVDAVNYNATHAAAGFVYKGARYHVWFNPRTMEREDKLFKNPTAKRGEPGHFDTRHLDATNAANAPIVAELFRQVEAGGLAAAAIAAKEAEHSASDRQHKEFLERQARVVDFFRSRPEIEPKAREVIEFLASRGGHFNDELLGVMRAYFGWKE